MKYRSFIYIVITAFLFSFVQSSPEPVELMVRQAKIYTMDEKFSVAEAMVISKGRIVATGSEKELLAKYNPAKITDAGNQFIYPGFIDAHAHFVAYSQSLLTVNLNGTSSWDECLFRIDAFLKTHQTAAGKWIVGFGWDQNDWKNKEFPDNSELNKRYPENYILLERVDGHAVIANSKALELAGIKPGQKIEGGDIQVKDGRLTGILVDNATELISRLIPAPSVEEIKTGLMAGQKNCLAKGLTTLDDCGLDISTIHYLQSLQESNQLKMRLYVMLRDNPDNLKYIEQKGAIKTDRMNVRSMKVYADGALGSRGACLLQPYSDKPGQTGFLLSKKEHYDSLAAFLYKAQFQMCTHAIGDSGNRVILNTYAKYLKPGNDLRWRIEHAQVVNQNDFKLFGQYAIIPSVQPTHATSDMYWAEDRLGKHRVKGAYAYKELLRQNGWIALGTDFPVEDIEPIKTFYAAVFRKDSKGYPANGFQPENALTREEALRGMTIWAAKSNFEEKEKGSIEPGKFADFIIADKDLVKDPENEILKMNIIKTYINGEIVFEQTTAK